MGRNLTVAGSPSHTQNLCPRGKKLGWGLQDTHLAAPHLRLLSAPSTRPSPPRVGVAADLAPPGRLCPGGLRAADP